MENLSMSACKGMNCGCTDGVSHSLECQAEHSAAIAGGSFVKGSQPVASEPSSVERARFESWADKTQPAYWSATAWAREAWEIWQAATPPALLSDDKPVDMVLYCPKCGTQHIDAPEPSMLTEDAAMYGGDWPSRWKNPPHKSHLCHVCAHIWRPSDTPTNGVARTASGKDADTTPKR